MAVKIQITRVGNGFTVDKPHVTLHVTQNEEIEWECKTDDYEIVFDPPADCPFPPANGWNNGKKKGKKRQKMTSGKSTEDKIREKPYGYTIESDGKTAADPEVSIKR